MANFLVTTNNDTVNPGDGMLSLREALESANANPGMDIIEFNLPGTNPITLMNGSLLITDTITIQTGDGPLAFEFPPIIIDGDSTGPVFEVVTPGDVVFRNIVIQNGSAPQGGGIFNDGADLLLEGVMVKDNAAESNGGGLFSQNGSVMIIDSVFWGNTATAPGTGNRGGGLFADDNVEIHGSIFSENEASRDGGGLSVTGGNILIDNSTISGNSAASGGGALLQGGGTIQNSLVTMNMATGGVGTGVGGGGILGAFSGGVSIINSVVAFNTSMNGGGGLAFQFGGSGTVSNSTVSGNTATLDGGGIYVDNGTLLLTNTQVSGNSAGFNGGGLFSNTGTTSIINSNFFFNTATNEGGGINVVDLTSENSNFFENTDGPGPNDLFTFDPLSNSTFTMTQAGAVDEFPRNVGTTPAQPGLTVGGTFVSLGNMSPTFGDDSKSVEIGDTVNVPLLNNDIDPDGDIVFIKTVGTPALGTVTMIPGGIRYESDGISTGVDTFTYTATDGAGHTGTATVTITVTLPNEPPVAGTDEATTDEDSTVDIMPLVNDTDLEGDPITLLGASAPAGIVTVLGDTVTFDPNGEFDALAVGEVMPVNITYTISDGNSVSEGLIALTVTGVNDPPSAVEDEATTNEDTSILIDVLDNDQDIDGGPLTVQGVGLVGTNQGSVEIENNMIRYTPNPDFEALTGTQSALVEVFYQVSDGLGGVDTGTVFVTVNGVNDAPVANPDTATTSLDTAVTIPVLNNDSDAEGPVTLVAAFPAAPSGTVTANPDGTITYTPEAGFTGTATFEYRITDSDGVTADAAVTVNVAPPNRPPVAMDDMDMVDEDTALTIAIADLLDNDGDPDIPVPGDMISFVDFFYLDLGPDVDGSMMRVGDNLIYTPDPNFNGDDFFTYTIRDIAGATDTAIVDITVKPVNDDPEAADKDVMTDEDKAITISIDNLLNDSDDVDGDMLSFDGFTYIDAGPDVDGSMVRVGNTLVYTPDKDFNGTDFFFYDISDGNGGTDTGTVNITVKPINDAPVANDDMVMTNEGEALFIQISDLLSNDDDVDIIDGDMISFDGFIYIDLGPEADGSLTRAGNVLVYRPDLDLDRDRFDPDDDFNGDDFFTYTISDKDGETSTATVDIVVKPVNDAPFANPDLFATDEDMAITLSFDELLGRSLRKLNPADEQEDTDPDFDAPGDDPTLFLDIIAVGGATRGNVVVDFLAGTITYTPDANLNGSDSFTYTIEDTGIGDPAGLRDVGVVTIRVDPVNDDPFIIPPQLELFTLPDLPVSYLVQAGDIDGDALTVTVSDPANGMLSDGPGFAEVIYTPDVGFTGTDGWTTLVTDVAGATASQQVTVTVGELPPADDFVAFASAGFTGGFGGSGQVVGDSGFQDITIFDQPGLITLDPSFNAANSPGLTDIVRLSGLASDWFIVRRGSSALLSDGDTFLLVPVGSKGIALVFDNFTLNLRFDTAENTFKIGEQSFGSDQFDQIAAIEELATLPTGSDPNAVAAMFVADDAAVSAGGRVDIFGTQGPQMFSLMGGRINFDPSSNSGGDTFTIPDFAIDGTGQRNGSSFFFDGPTTDLLIPVGTTASTLNFADGPRDLLFNTASNNIELGGQIIGFTPVELMALG